MNAVTTVWLAGALLLSTADTPKPGLSEANALVAEQDYAAAEELLDTLLEASPDDVRLLILQGEVLLAMGVADEALPLLERALALEPDRARLNFQIATARAQTGDSEGALAAFARELELTEDDEVKVLARLNRAMLLSAGRKWRDASVELEAVLALAPDRGPVFGDLASLYMEAGRLPEAADALARGRAAGFSSADHHYNLGARFYTAGAYSQAVETLGQALELDPTLAPAERSLAAALEKLGRDAEAVKHLRRYLELRPNAPDAEKISQRIRETATR